MDSSYNTSFNTNQNQTHQPTFFDPVYNPVWSTNIQPEPSFTRFGATQNNEVYLHSQPPVSWNINTSPGYNHRQVRASTKNSKKRRASKRAPTTVLTTNVTNFRQMVQEYTGIPNAPLTSYSQSFGVGGIGSSYPVPPTRLQNIQISQNPRFLGATKSDDRVLDVLRWYPSTSTQWRGPNENNASNVHNLINRDLESVISSRDGGDQVQDNVDSWILPF